MKVGMGTLRLLAKARLPTLSQLDKVICTSSDKRPVVEHGPLRYDSNFETKSSVVKSLGMTVVEIELLGGDPYHPTLFVFK
jgi:hypothetical protein